MRDDLLFVLYPDVVGVLEKSRQNGSRPVYKVTYEQIATLCGLSLRSGDGPREILVDRRNNGFCDEIHTGLWFTEWPGRGITFTADPVLGNAWLDNYAEIRFLSHLARSERGWRHAMKVIPSQAPLIRKILKSRSATSSSVRGCRRSTLAQISFHDGKLRDLLESAEDALGGVS